MPYVPVKLKYSKYERQTYVSLYAIPNLLLINETLEKRIVTTRETRFEKLDSLAQDVCKHFKFTIQKLRSSNRMRELVLARHLFLFIANMNTDFTLVDIGRYIKRDHTTVIHAREKIINFIGINDKMVVDALNALCPRALDIFKRKIY